MSSIIGKLCEVNRERALQIGRRITSNADTESHIFEDLLYRLPHFTYTLASGVGFEIFSFSIST